MVAAANQPRRGYDHGAMQTSVKGVFAVGNVYISVYSRRLSLGLFILNSFILHL